MSRLNDALMSRRELLAVSGIAASAAIASSCAERTAGLIQTGAAVRRKVDVPIVVIGSGLGAMTAAAYLAKSGFTVTVVERHHLPGGYATSFERMNGRFIFDVSLHMLSAHGSTTETVLRELGLSEKVELVKLPGLCRIITKDCDIRLPQEDPEGCAAAFATCFPDEKIGIEKFINEIVGAAEDVDRLKARMSLLDKILFPFRFPFLTKNYNATLANMVNRHIKEPKLKSLLSAFWGYYGLPPSKLSGLYYSVGTGQYIKDGAYCYKPRSFALSTALKDVIEQNGGRMIFNQEVDKILLTQNEVSGAHLVGGAILPARAVISGASAPSTFRKMLPEDSVSSGYLSRLEELKPSLSSFVVWLGLNHDIRDQVKDYEVFLLGAGDSEASYRAQLQCDAARSDIAVTFFDNAFDGYSAPGTNTMSIMFVTGYKPWKRFESDYIAGEKRAYNLEKARIAQTLIERAERSLVMGLSSMIEVMEVGTPLSNVRYTKNQDGAIYGYEQTLDNSLNKRIENRTPVKGLYLASAWGFPGGGFCGVHSGGRKAFQEVMEDWG